MLILGPQRRKASFEQIIIYIYGKYFELALKTLNADAYANFDHYSSITIMCRLFVIL